MKTIKCGNEIKRVTDSKALELVEAGKLSEAPVSEKWGYCAKSEWKRRNAPPPAPARVVTPEDVLKAKGIKPKSKSQQRRLAAQMAR